MAIRIRGLRGFTLRLAVLAALAVGPTSVHALAIEADPGAIGALATSPLVLGQLVTPGDPKLDVSLINMLHIEAVSWGFSIVEEPFRFPVPFRFFLTDETSTQIPGTELSGLLISPFPGTLVLFSGVQGLTLPVTAHDIHFEFGDAETPILSDLLITVFVEGRVGVWGIPEPSTLTLFGAGLLGLALLARRRRKAA